MRTNHTSNASYVPDALSALLASPLARNVMADAVAEYVADREDHLAAMAMIAAQHIENRDRLDQEVVQTSAVLRAARAALEEAEAAANVAKFQRQVCFVAPQGQIEQHSLALRETAPHEIADFIARCLAAWSDLPCKSSVITAPSGPKGKLRLSFNEDEIVTCREALIAAIKSAEAMQLEANPGDGDVTKALASLAESVPELAWR